MTTLVAVLGPHPLAYGTRGRTTRNDIHDMVAATPGADLTIIPDMVRGMQEALSPALNPLDTAWGITQMRNMAVERAMDYNHLLLVENDVRPQPDTLTKLLCHSKPVVIPRPWYVSCPPVEFRCYDPPIDGTYPLHQISWAPHSIVLFSTPAMVKVPVMFASSREGTDHKRWAKFLGPAYMALDTSVDVLRVPSGFREETKTQQLPPDYE